MRHPQRAEAVATAESIGDTAERAEVAQPTARSARRRPPATRTRNRAAARRPRSPARLTMRLDPDPLFDAADEPRENVARADLEPAVDTGSRREPDRLHPAHGRIDLADERIPQVAARPSGRGIHVRHYRN